MSTSTPEEVAEEFLKLFGDEFGIEKACADENPFSAIGFAMGTQISYEGALKGLIILAQKSAEPTNFEYAYATESARSGGPKPASGVRIIRLYQSFKQFAKSGYLIPGFAWRRRVGPWEKVDGNGNPLR